MLALLTTYHILIDFISEIWNGNLHCPRALQPEQRTSEEKSEVMQMNELLTQLCKTNICLIFFNFKVC